MAGQTREPGSELHGEAQIRIFDAGGYVEAPFADGRGAAGVGGRYSYTTAIFSLFSRNTTLDYRDYNARVSYDLNDRWRATAFTFGSFDLASQVDNRGIDQVLSPPSFIGSTSGSIGAAMTARPAVSR